jgi:hypothetical protein
MEKKSLDGLMLRKTGRKSFKILVNAERGKNLMKILNTSTSRKKLKFCCSYFGSVSLNFRERKIAETLRREGGREPFLINVLAGQGGGADWPDG